MTGDESVEHSGRAPKVARLLDAYEFEGLGEELERRWTASGEERASLRELADEFNRRLLERRLADAGVHAVAGEAANHYRLLTDDEVTAADRTRARRQLERAGVDVQALRDEFVSYQAIRTYLREYRDVEYVDDTDPVAQAEQTVGRLRTRLAAVTESKLETARRADEMDLDSYDVTVAVRVDCRNCGRQLPVERVLETGGCGCQ